MHLPDSLYDSQYITELREFREEALVRSHWQGVRRSLGAISFGKRFAEWQSQEDGCASLRDEGLRIGSMALTWAFPTVLKVVEGQTSDTETLTFYNMCLDSPSFIAVEKRVVCAQGRALIPHAHPKVSPAPRPDIHVPTYEDLHKLYDEMKRGASGHHPPRRYNIDI